jgi:hypothetical protein
MNQLAKPHARTPIDVADAAEIARLAGKPGRDMFAREDLEDQLGSGPLILDGLRGRPHYFDGRFLTGADLTRDQDYVRQRQADMARAAGSGVISGLGIRTRAVARGQTIRIDPGVGLTPSGDVVMVTQRRDVPLLDLPLSRQLDAAMGLREEPRVPLGRRTGLFILALRAVEFTANPIAAYPRSISGRRTVEDGDIIEATAITLIPYPETSGAGTLALARRAVARQIFAGQPSGIPQDALPLAMLAVENGTVRWIDVAMVRRETGMDSGVQVAFGGRPRSLAEAHLLQHRAHLADVVAEMQARGEPPIFAAAQHFGVLPPAGQLPAAAIRPDPFGFSQVYFPPTVDVDLAFVPIDEIGALVEESLSLPPIDLDAQAAELDATGVLIMVPVTRQRFQRFDNGLPATKIATVPNAGAAAARPAFDMLTALVSKRRKLVEAAERDADSARQAEAEALKIKAWHAAFQEAVTALPMQDGRPPTLWYTRRRAIAYQTRIVGVGVAVSGDDIAIGETVNANIDRLNLGKRLAALTGKATAQAIARIIALLGSRAVARSDILTVSAIADLERVAKGRGRGGFAVGDMTALPGITSFDFGTIGSGTAIPVGTSGRVEDAAVPSFASAGRFDSAVGVSESSGLAFSTVRTGLARVAVANALGRTTAVRADTELSLSEGEVMDVAEDYGGPRVGEGLDRLDQALGEAWPDAKGAIWLGGTGKALAVDAAFRAVPGEKLADFAELMKQAVDKENSGAIDSLFEKMR